MNFMACNIDFSIKNIPILKIYLYIYNEVYCHYSNFFETNEFELLFILNNKKIYNSNTFNYRRKSCKLLRTFSQDNYFFLKKKKNAFIKMQPIQFK